MLLWLFARSLWNSVTAGLASASFCWIARAAWYDASASSGLPVSARSLPMLLWLLARSCWNPVTVGLASASFCWIARAASIRRQRLGRLAGLSQEDADAVVATRQVALVLSDGGFGTGHTLQQRPRFRVRRPPLVRLPDFGQEIAQVDQATADFGLRLAVGVRRISQLPAHRQRLTVVGNRLVGRADLARQHGHLEVGLPQRPPRQSGRPGPRAGP